MLTENFLKQAAENEVAVRRELTNFLANPEQHDQSACFTYEEFRKTFPMHDESYTDFYDRIHANAGSAEKLAQEFTLELSREHIPEGDGIHLDFVFRVPIKTA